MKKESTRLRHPRNDRAVQLIAKRNFQLIRHQSALPSFKVAKRLPVFRIGVDCF
jgi:hypothetical protein